MITHYNYLYSSLCRCYCIMDDWIDVYTIFYAIHFIYTRRAVKLVGL